MPDATEAAGFTDWLPWHDGPRFDRKSFLETMDGGQAFRWLRFENFLEGRWSDQICRIRIPADNEPTALEFALPQNTCTDSFLSSIGHYFAFDSNFSQLQDQLPWRSDPVLHASMQAFPNLQILRQPFAECLFSFLCSSTKQISQIKVIHEALAVSIGSKLSDGSHALPNWSQIANAGEPTLREAKLGYRARYIHACAQIIVARPGWLETVENLPTEQARAELIQLPGVGRKIADCVLLFGAGRLDAFPIDTWIEKILTHAYHLEGWSTTQMQQFAKIHFGELAGYAQQYLFAAARARMISIA